MQPADFGVYGLGVMGASLTLNLADRGHIVAGYNRAEGIEAEVVNDFLAANATYSNLFAYTDVARFVQSLQTPRKILLMVKAGRVVDLVLEQLRPLLTPGDIVIDGGNSHYLATERRIQEYAAAGLHLVGMGVSGGETGARFGPALMPAAEPAVYAQIAPFLESIAARDRRGLPCCTNVGRGGAGHFVKMIHNGIEYAEMQLLAELYALLTPTLDYTTLADIFAEWNATELGSYLLEITAKILRKQENGQYLLDMILDKAGNKGTGSWSVKAAFDLGSVNTMMAAAVFARYVSAFKSQRVVWSKQLNNQQATTSSSVDINTYASAYRAARILNHQQGFAVMTAASQLYKWELNFTEIARIWTNGCIIRSELMERCVAIFKNKEELLADNELFNLIKKDEAQLAELLQNGIAQRTATPAFTAAYHHWINLTTARLPANLIQAQRDFFGAHTYQRVDGGEQFFHTEWEVEN